MTTSQNPNARLGSLAKQPQCALRHVKSQNPPPLAQIRKHPRSQSECASRQRNDRSRLGHAPLRNAANSKSRASARIAGNLPYRTRPAVQIAPRNIGRHGDLANRTATTGTTSTHNTPPQNGTATHRESHQRCRYAVILRETLCVRATESP